MKYAILFLFTILCTAIYSQKKGFVIIVSNQNCEIIIDGQKNISLLKNTPQKHEFLVGQHFLKANSTNGEKTQIFSVEENNQNLINIEFSSKAIHNNDTKKNIITTFIVNSDSKLHIDGNSLEESTLIAYKENLIYLPIGDNKIRITPNSSIFKPWTETIKVSENGNNVFKIELSGPKSLSFTSEQSSNENKTQVPHTTALNKTFYTLCQRSINLSSFEELYYALDKDDELELSAFMTNKKGSFNVQVIRYQNNEIIYSKSNSTFISNDRIKIRNKGIYIINIQNNALFSKEVKIALRRRPLTQKGLNFNTTVLKKSKYIPVEIIPSNSFYVNSTSNEKIKGGTNEISIPIKIPKNAVKCYYTISASRLENDIKSSTSLLENISSVLIDNSLINLGIEAITTPPGADYCNVYFLDEVNNQNFLREEPFNYIINGSRINIKSAKVELPTIGKNNYFLGIENTDLFHGIHINLEVVAVYEETYLEQE